MKNSSLQTKSFVILFAVAMVGTYFCLLLANKLQDIQSAKNSSTPGGVEQIIYPPTASASVQEPVVDTSDWKTYVDEKLGVSFKYKPTWQIKPTVKQNGFYITDVDPGKKFYNIKIYASKAGYYAMDSLPAKEVSIAGKNAQDVSDMLYGIQNGPYYFTFDLGLSVSLKPDFNALVKSVSFAQ